MALAHRPEHELSTGAKPLGAVGEAAAAHAVQEMFDTIAPTYDRANHLLSAGIDRYWWTRAARAFRPILARPDARILDLCCGTGDMALHLLRHRPHRHHKNPVVLSGGEAAVEGPAVPSATEPAPILAIDFSHQMLHRGAQKFAPHNILPIEADALHLPIASGSLDLVTSAFGFRNLANYEEGLAELFASSAPGGQIGILDCNQPSGLVGALYSPLLQAHPAQTRRPRLRHPRRLQLSSRLRRALPSPATHVATHPTSRLYQRHLDQLHPRHRPASTKPLNYLRMPEAHTSEGKLWKNGFKVGRIGRLTISPDVSKMALLQVFVLDEDI